MSLRPPWELAHWIEGLTTAALAGLLLGIGMRLSVAQLLEALRDQRLLVRILLVNFLAVPMLAVGVIISLDIPPYTAMGMILLAAAPFAPVVPVFARLAKVDLALAAALTASMPLISCILTPIVCKLCVQALPESGPLVFRLSAILVSLCLIVTLPLALGLALRIYVPGLARKVLRPVETVAETAGALSLAIVVVSEVQAIANLGFKTLLGMALLSEIALLLGYAVGGRDVQARRVAALGTSNRNIALALLVAVDNFPGTPVVPTVVANGLLLILLGLLHTGWFRLRSQPAARAGNAALS